MGADVVACEISLSNGPENGRWSDDDVVVAVVVVVDCCC